MFLWNLFKITGKQFTLADGVYKLIEKSLKDIDSSAATDPIRKFETDNRALLLLLKGACLRHMKSPLKALKYGNFKFWLKFTSVIVFLNI